MASLLSRAHLKIAATSVLLPIGLVLAADSFGGCSTSVDTEPTSSSSSKASVAASTSTGMGGAGPSSVSSTSSTGGAGGAGGTGGGMPTCKNQNTGDDTCALASA